MQDAVTTQQTATSNVPVAVSVFWTLAALAWTTAAVFALCSLTPHSSGSAIRSRLQTAATLAELGLGMAIVAMAAGYCIALRADVRRCADALERLTKDDDCRLTPTKPD